MMKMSEKGATALTTEEGNVLQAYPDPKWGWSVPTIGVGHTGPDVYRGLVWTPAQSLAALEADLATRGAVINEMIPAAYLNQNRVDAVCSWGHNVGTGAMRSSHLMLYWSQGNLAAASAEFPKWNIPAMLIARRARERAMFEGTSLILMPVVHTVSTAQLQSFLGVTPADDVYGPITATAVAHWQAVHGLVADGLVGPRTIAAMGL